MCLDAVLQGWALLMTQLMHVTERVLRGNNLAVYSGFKIGLVSTWKTLHDLCLHNVRVWEMFHVLLNPSEILNSASFCFRFNL